MSGNPFEYAKATHDAYLEHHRRLRDTEQALRLGVEGLKAAYAADHLEIEDLERLLPIAIAAGREAEHRLTDAPGAVIRTKATKRALHQHNERLIRLAINHANRM